MTYRFAVRSDPRNTIQDVAGNPHKHLAAIASRKDGRRARKRYNEMSDRNREKYFITFAGSRPKRYLVIFWHISCNNTCLNSDGLYSISLGVAYFSAVEPFNNHSSRPLPIRIFGTTSCTGTVVPLLTQVMI